MIGLICRASARALCAQGTGSTVELNEAAHRVLCVVALAAVAVAAATVGAMEHGVPFMPAASDEVRQGFVRVMNHDDEAGLVEIVAFDDEGTAYGPITLSLSGRQTIHFNSDELEGGNEGKGLSGGVGPGTGDWRLALTSELDVEVLAFVRTKDGFLTAMHDVVPQVGAAHRVATFNPGRNRNQVSLLRVVNIGDSPADVSVTGIDGSGQVAGPVSATIPARAAQTYSAAELESGGDGLTGALGSGTGKWQLAVESPQPLDVMSLMRSPTGHMTNLSTAPASIAAGSHAAASCWTASLPTLTYSSPAYAAAVGIAAFCEVNAGAALTASANMQVCLGAEDAYRLRHRAASTAEPDGSADADAFWPRPRSLFFRAFDEVLAALERECDEHLPIPWSTTYGLVDEAFVSEARRQIQELSQAEQDGS